ncbi:MAG: glucose-1-phosphate thymidylyltransferase RfbA [Chlamydiota bacterium]|nr:glucose-1-phosphate thymidylyltransferase RfbA [Chlamydiota bacterium]
MRKGIILAGGSGTRLYPATEVISKQLLPIYDKPMVYYPLSVLMLAGIRDILLISTPEDLPRFKLLLKDGSQWGINLTYMVQEKPEGLAQAFILGKQFIGNDPCCMILGDNLFYGHDLAPMLQSACSQEKGATIFAYKVNNPQRYGVVEFNSRQKAVRIVEKPKENISRFAVTGLYFYDNDVTSIAEGLKPSKRGELEISDINQHYLEKDLLEVEVMSRGIAWLDTGTFESLLNAGHFIETIQKRQGVKIACLEEIAFRMGYISAEELSSMAEKLSQNSYGQYLLDILEEI